jgi:hypothetical protein
MPLYSVRLDSICDEVLAAAARDRKVSRAVILREAISEYASATARKSSPFERLSSLIGIIEDGPGNLSEQTGKGLARILEQRRTRSAVPAARPAKRRPTRTLR